MIAFVFNEVIQATLVGSDEKACSSSSITASGSFGLVSASLFHITACTTSHTDEPEREDQEDERAYDESNKDPSGCNRHCLTEVY